MNKTNLCRKQITLFLSLNPNFFFKVAYNKAKDIFVKFLILLFMIKFYNKNGVNCLVESGDIMLSSVVVKAVNGNKEVRVFRKMDDGTLKELKKVRSAEKSQIKSETPVEVTSNATATKRSINNKVVVIDEESNRKIGWRKFRTAIIKAGGIDVYMKSRRDDSAIEALLLKYPDFKRGMKLYEEGSNGAWSLMAERTFESVRRTYHKYYMDLDLLLAA